VTALEKFETKRLQEILDRFSKAKIAVLGDFFLDLYIQMDRSLSELSLETQKEAFQAVSLRGQPGAAGVVTNNLTALGSETLAIAYTGRDGNGYTLRQALADTGVHLEYLIETSERFTPTYTKPMMHEVNGSIIELNRIDIINRTPNPPALNQNLAVNIKQAIRHCNGLLVVEQVRQDGYGTLSPLVRKTLAEVAQAYPQKTFIVDSRHFSAWYTQVALKMNLSEAFKAIRIMSPSSPIPVISDTLKAAKAASEILWEITQKPVFITLGSLGLAGMVNDQFFHWPGVHLEGPVDVVGAGDSVLAGIGLALCSGASEIEAAYIGNLVGSITVQQLGTTGIATPEAIFKRHDEYQKQITN
jgi:rfaE bifunctional protein kinase chain/domain